jgi:peptidoglycan/LPS O-acetylase OafA/YrhL
MVELQTSQQHRQRALVLGDVLKSKDNSFGVLRLAMALAVLLSHCFYLQYGSMSAEPLIQWTGYTLGQHGVQVFFVLSGVLVTQSIVTSRSLIDFATARTVRILPALAVCVLLVSVFLGPAVSSLSLSDYFKDPRLPGYILKTVFLTTGSAPLPGVFNDLPAHSLVNSSLWTLKYEVACYVLLAASSWVAITTGRQQFVFGVMAAVSALLFVSYQPRLAETNGMLANISYFWLFFGTGILAYLMRAHLQISATVLAALSMLMLLSVGTPLAELTTAVALGYGAIWLSTWQMGPLRNFANTRDYSYGVYIYGVPVTQTILHLRPEIGTLALILATAVITLFVAALSWAYVERPVLAWHRNLRGQRSKAAAIVPTAVPA